MAMAGGVHQVGQPPGLAPGGREPLRRQPVVAPAIFVRFVVERDGQLLDQAVHQHSLNRAVQGARAQPGIAVGEALDVLHDAVAVRLAVGEREQDVKDGRSQQRTRFVAGIRPITLRRGCNHRGYMYRRVMCLSSERR